MLWVACESADKHAGGNNTNNNIEKILLRQEHFTALQLSPATRDGPGARHPPVLLLGGFALHRHCCWCRVALCRVLGVPECLDLLRHLPASSPQLLGVIRAAKPGGWCWGSVSSGSKQSC